LYATCGVSFLRAGSWAEATDIFERVPVGSHSGGFVSAGGRALLELLAGRWEAYDRLCADIERLDLPQEAINNYPGSLYELAQMTEALLAADFGQPSVRLKLYRGASRFDRLEFRPVIVAAAAVDEVLGGRPGEAVAEALDLRRTDGDEVRLLPLDALALHVVDLLHRLEQRRFGDAERMVATLPSAAWRDLCAAYMALITADAPRAAELLSASRVGSSRHPVYRCALELLVSWHGVLIGESGQTTSALRRFVSASRLSRMRGVLALVPSEVRAAMRSSCTDPRVLDLFDEVAAGVAAPFCSGPQAPSLTARERAVLRELRYGGSYAQVADRLGVSRNTVKTQLRTAYRKLGADDRNEALARLTEFGIDLDSAGS
jgi:LuxR family maltose regulon positive regulatory protein